jgi:hypothetical protein
MKNKSTGVLLTGAFLILTSSYAFANRVDRAEQPNRIDRSETQNTDRALGAN